MSKDDTKVTIQDGSEADTIDTRSTQSREERDQAVKQKEPDLEMQGERPSTPKRVGEYPNAEEEIRKLEEAKALVEECQQLHEAKLRANRVRDTMYLRNEPMRERELNVPTPIPKETEEGSQGNTMSRMFEEDVQDESIHSFPRDGYETHTWKEPSIVKEPRDIGSLTAVVSTSMQMPLEQLLRGSPTLWVNIKEWVEGAD